MVDASGVKSDEANQEVEGDFNFYARVTQLND